MAPTKWQAASQKILSDCLFTTLFTGFLLAARRHAFNKVYIMRKISPFASSLLSYQKYKAINSQMDYVRRASLYILSAAALDCLYSDVDGSILDFGKGLSAGICFVNLPVGLFLGVASFSGNYLIKNQLSEFV